MLSSNAELWIRAIVFFSLFFIIWGWELKNPARTLSLPRLTRWRANLSILIIDIFVVRLCFPMAAVGFAVVAQQQGYGLMTSVEWPLMIQIPLSILLLDLIIYWQHRISHLWPMLWRFHKVHHADLDYDLTTGTRFHPVEIVFSMLVKLAAIIIIGPPVIAVLIFELILIGMAIFNHANARLPQFIDKQIRKILVTPDMHRVHHSSIRDETDSNFGFNLSIWDKLFNTYRAQPTLGHQGMTIGLDEYRNPRQSASVLGMLTMPFTRPRGAHPESDGQSEQNWTKDNHGPS